MKRKNADVMGNALMGLGLLVMIGGVGYSIVAEVSQFNLPQFSPTERYSVSLSAPCCGWPARVSADVNRLRIVIGG